ncbi:MFS transporter [Clostridium sp. YIM B02515]|uniref:MFS transporter n=1 Tax=Clostridium rhizosphaerae TaxID=2803861 RepID=A0ABS1T5M8_9CLOT|nr:MFS transporter [Clostridium rhizosphaerae]MBL4934625.1 MFS transporter [Clostridium rhizosphaerae]
MTTCAIKKWQRKIFVLCWIAYASIYFGRVNISVAIPAIQNSLNLSKAQIGIIGSLFFWIYGAGQLINGYIGDKISSRKFMFIGLFVTAVSNILFGFSASLIIMCLLWSINGYFQSMIWGPMVKTLSHWLPEEKRSSTAVAISTSMVGGYLLSWGLSGAIISHSSWQWAFWLPGSVILVYSCIWYLCIRDHPNDVGLQSPNDQISSTVVKSSKNSESLLTIINKSKLWLIVIACFAQGIIKDGIGLWGPTFLMETHKIDMKSTVGLIMFIPIMNFFGILAAGWLNKIFKNEEKIPVIILFSFSMVLVFLLVKLGGISIILAVLLLGLISSMMYGANTLLLGIVPMKFAKYNRVSAIAGFLDFCSYVASGLAAALTGFIVDWWGWNGILIFWIGVSLAGFISLFISLMNSDK